MSKDQTESPNIQIISSTLENLSKVRLTRGGWFDSEKETVERETLAFKIAESLRCFLIVQELLPNAFSIATLGKDTFHSDIKQVLMSVKRDGFVPSPYSPIQGSKDQYTDFAAFCLEFSELVHNYASATKLKSLRTLSEFVAKKALNFLTNPKHFKNGDEQCRWAGTEKFSRTKKKNLIEYFTDVYFTSVVIIALKKVLDRPVLSLSEKEQEKIKSLIRNAGRWIVSRAESGLLTGDEKKTVKSLIYSTWGLRALIETYDTQDDDVRDFVLPMAGAYIKAIDEKLEKEAVSIGQEYLSVLSQSSDKPQNYEDRSDWGGILLTLVSLRTLRDSDELLMKAHYKQVLDRVYNGILLLRDPLMKLWYKDYFILSIHSYLTEGLILYDRHAKDFGLEFDINSGMLRKALKDMLADDSILNTLHQVVYRNLLKSTQHERQNKAIEKGFVKFNDDDSSQASKPSFNVGRKRSRKRRTKIT